MELFSLTGKVALVTGAMQGIGQAIAAALAEAGADVALLDKYPCTETCALIAAAGRRSHDLTVDLRDFGTRDAADVIARSAEALGRLDILVNNAGIISRSSALEMGEENWAQVLQVDLHAAFYLSQAAAGRFTQMGQGGKIINICSMLSFQGGLNVAAYTAAKSGLAGLTRALANEWAALGINVNAIAPGYIETEVTAGIRADPERCAAILSRIPAGRWGVPDDIKGAAAFLASSASDYVHGTIIPVDGGWLAW